MRAKKLFRTLAVTMLVIGVGLFAFCPLFAQAQIRSARGSVSSDEVLQYTLTELKDRLRDVVEENSKLSARNNSLRKRMISLQQDMRELENHKLNMMERNNDLRDFLKMDSQENRVTKKKIMEVQEQNAFTGDVGGTLYKTVENNEKRQHKLQRAIAKTEADLAQLREVRSAKRLSFSENGENKKNAILSRIQKIGAGNRALEKELLGVNRKAADARDKKRSLGAKQTALNSEIQDTTRILDEAVAQEKDMSAQVKNTTEHLDQSSQGLEAQVDWLTDRYKQMSSSVQELSAARDKVPEDSGKQEIDVRNLSNLLANEKQLLQQQKRILLTRLEHLQGFGDDQSKTNEEKISALTEKLESLKAENVELKNKITEQERQGLEFKDKEAAVQKEMAQLNQDIKTAQQQGRQSKEEALKSRKAHLTGLVKDYQAKNEALKKRIADRQHQQQLSKEKVGSWQKHQGDLELAVKDRTAELAKAQEEEPVLREEAKTLESQRGKTGEELQKEVDTLELRKSVLLSSVEAIRNKYNQDKDTIKDFLHRDQKELKDYLEVLKAENIALKDKAQSLAKTVRQLEKK